MSFFTKFCVEQDQLSSESDQDDNSSDGDANTEDDVQMEIYTLQRQIAVHFEHLGINDDLLPRRRVYIDTVCTSPLGPEEIETERKKFELAVMFVSKLIELKGRMSDKRFKKFVKSHDGYREHIDAYCAVRGDDELVLSPTVQKKLQAMQCAMATTEEKTREKQAHSRVL